MAFQFTGRNPSLGVGLIALGWLLIAVGLYFSLPGLTPSPDEAGHRVLGFAVSRTAAVILGYVIFIVSVTPGFLILQAGRKIRSAPRPPQRL